MGDVPSRETVQQALDWYEHSGMLPHSVHVAFEALRCWLAGTPPQVEVANNRIGLPREQRVVDEAMIQRAAYELERLLYASSSFSKDVAKAVLRAALVSDDYEDESEMSVSSIVLAENLGYLSTLVDGSADLIYIDPPFNSGKVQSTTRLRTVADESGDRVGFKGRRYKTLRGDTKSFADQFDNFIDFLIPRFEQAYRVLAADGSFFLHIDYREAHYCKVTLDQLFGRASFMNEIIWAYDYGGRPKNRWPAKHDTILWYAKDPDNYTFNFDEMDRIPYMAPGLVTKEKANRGKTPTDVWWHTIVPTNGKERTGYPTQKPLGVLERIVKVHSRKDDHVLDFFAGSGTTGDAAARNGRRFTLVDNNPEAVDVMARRLEPWAPSCVGFEPPDDWRTDHQDTNSNFGAGVDDAE